MPFDPDLCAIRFGTGLSPLVPAPGSSAEVLAILAGPDHAAEAWHIPPYAVATPSLDALRLANMARREAAGTPEVAAAEAAYDELARAHVEALAHNVKATIARKIGTSDGLRERLVMFWSDHFTVRAKTGFLRHLVTPYVEEAVRPHVNGRFADMLKAVETHPVMLAYLDQTNSMGPNSVRAQRRDRGLNENLAREILELHTIGVDGPYDQRDVRQLAELLTGLGLDRQGTVYRSDHAEPGGETVLGVTYSAEADLSTVEAALDGLADHPSTARHISRKLAVHFVSEEPDQGLVDTLTARFVATDGDLLEVTAAMLDHPAAWVPERQKVKWPLEFMSSALRALGIAPEMIMTMEARHVRQMLQGPLAVMGQPWETAPGPDGWSERAEAWITPQGLAARINWAMHMPRRITEDLPDPRDLVSTALGPLASEEIVFAAGAAEDRAEGVGIVLASADFQRR